MTDITIGIILGFFVLVSEFVVYYIAYHKGKADGRREIL